MVGSPSDAPCDLAMLCAVLAVMLGALLTSPPIGTRGEAREGLVVREMVTGGDWLLPRRQGVIASKPSLYHWLAASVVRLLGWSDTAIRRGAGRRTICWSSHLLDRPLMRERVTCTGANGASYYLRPVASGALATPLERVAVFGDVELGRCAAVHP